MNNSFPVRFRSVHYLALLFKASGHKVNQLLENTNLKPALHWGSNPVVALGLIQYKDSDLGAYNEIILSIPTVLPSDPSTWKNWLNLYAKKQSLRVGQYIIHIPVTTQRSVDAGQQLWGYPKTLQPIEHNFQGKNINSCLYTNTGNLAFEIKGNLGMHLPLPKMNLLTYSMLNHSQVKTWVDVNAEMLWHPFADVQIKINDQSDRLCIDLMELGMHSEKPLFVMQSPHFSANFNSPEKID